MVVKHAASDIAKWFLLYNDTLVNEQGAEYITNLKLQKLLYYAQGSNLAVNNEPLFNDPIVKWMHGPVIRSVYDEYKVFGDNGIPYQGGCTLDAFDEQTNTLLEEVYSVFGQYSAWQLRNMTHEETPWKEASPNGVISQASIRDYFIKNYIGD